MSPFSGALGDRMLAAAVEGHPERTASIAHAAVARSIDECPSSVLVFDRHWMTVLTLVPEKFWEPWLPPPPTTLCWADVNTTIRRLDCRGEAKLSRGHHSYYIARYRNIAERFDCQVLSTVGMSETDSLARLIAWAQRYV